MAQPILTVYAYGNVDALHGMFNAVAMVMGSGDFGDMIRVAVLIGFLVVGVLAVNPKNLSKGWNWFICVAVLSGVVLTPKATVTIEDKLGQQPPAVVENVPWLLGVFASVKSSIGATLTDLFETAFQSIPNDDRALPSELGYLEHGVVFGNRLIRGSREADFSALHPQGDTLNYLRNCIFPDLGREQVPGSFEHSTSLIDAISDPNPALFSSYHDDANGGNLVVAGCDKVFPHVRQSLDSSAVDALKTLSTRLMPNLSPEEAQEKVAESLETIYGKSSLAALGSSAQDIMIQNILINATADASALYAASLNDPAVLMFASMRAQAVGSMNAGYLVQGRIAEEALPIVRNITEALLYAVFPILCILAVASEGRALAAVAKGYLYTLIWVELWPPMFAVVNYLQTLHSVANLQAAGSMPTSLGLSLQTATGVYSTAVSDVAVASWMVTFVPVIAGAVLFGMDRLMSITGTRPGTFQTENEASQATKGNQTMGNVSFEQQQLAAYRSEPSMVTHAGVGGETSTDLLSGGARYRHSLSSGPVSVNDMSSLAREQSQAASRAIELGQGETRLAESSLSSAFSRLDSLASSGALGKEVGSAWSLAKDAVSAEDASDARRTGEELAAHFGVKDSVSIAKALTGGLSTPLIIDALGLSAKGTLTGAAEEAATRQIEEARRGLHERSLARNMRTAEQFSKQRHFREGRAADIRSSEDVRADLQRAASYRDAASAHFSTASQFQENERKLRALQHSWTINNANAFYEFAAREGKYPGNPNIKRGEWTETLRRFLAAGEVARDDDGEFFMPQIGQGPNILQGSGPSTLREGFDSVVPREGQGRVLDIGAKNREEVRAAQRKSGVTAKPIVDGRAIQGQVDAGHSSVAAGIGRENEGIDASLLGEQLTSDAAFQNAPGQQGDSFVRVIAADADGKASNPAVHANRQRPRPGKELADEASSKPTPKIPNQ